MTWAVLVPLIIQYGLPWVLDLWQIIQAHPEPNAEAWDKLLALSQKTMLTYINESRAKVGMPPLTSYDPAVDPGAPSKP